MSMETAEKQMEEVLKKYEEKGVHRDYPYSLKKTKHKTVLKSH